jgi:hypothetical protein
VKKISLNEYCPCCGYNTFNSNERLVYDICPICFWEDDPIQFQNPQAKGGANNVSLIEAQTNFNEFGACEKIMVQNVRKPETNDLLNPEWK